LLGLIVVGRGEKITNYNSEDGGIATFDLNLDGLADGISIDLDSNGISDIFKYDLDHDNIVDFSTYDTDADGIAESVDINNDGVSQSVVDILRRFVIHVKIREKSAIFYNYDIQDGDRPDVIAHKYYGDSKYDWVVLLTNKMLDPNYDWPLGYENFRKFIIDN